LISCSVGFGPRTEAIFLKPKGLVETLPGVVALHDCGYYKFFGKDKIANGSDGPMPELLAFHSRCYEGRAVASALAREGLGAVVPDAFMWGSRRFPLETMQELDGVLATESS
jgi:dienelactone hydrolase